MKTYGQYCPIARACEILTRRWSLLILRDLLYGARRFNELRRGVPLMSPSLLSQRLKDFEKFGLVVRVRRAEKGVVEYQPTLAARELQPVIELLGIWGQRWVRNRLGKDELDVGLLMWYVRCLFDASMLPPGRTVVGFEYTDRPRLRKDNWWLDRWWLVVTDGEVDLCLHDPGHDVDVYLVTDLGTMTKVWMGDISRREAVRSGAIELHGSRRLVEAFETWMPISDLANVARPPETADYGRILAAYHAEAAE